MNKNVHLGLKNVLHRKKKKQHLPVDLDPKQNLSMLFARKNESKRFLPKMKCPCNDSENSSGKIGKNSVAFFIVPSEPRHNLPFQGFPIPSPTAWLPVPQFIISHWLSGKMISKCPLRYILFGKLLGGPSHFFK